MDWRYQAPVLGSIGAEGLGFRGNVEGLGLVVVESVHGILWSLGYIYIYIFFFWGGGGGALNRYTPKTEPKEQCTSKVTSIPNPFQDMGTCLT